MKQYWRSLGELENTPEFRGFLEREFPENASEAPDGITRRTMLTLMGASLSLAGLGACRRPVAKIVPYVTAPEEIVPGIPLRYATTMPFDTNAYGLVVESHEGRPTKIEGNEIHPSTGGASSAWVQASIWDLYDPDRARSVTEGGAERTWKDFVERWKRLAAELGAKRGEGLAILAAPSSSPTEARVVAELRSRLPRARLVTWAPLGDENVYAGIAAATGAVYEPVLHFDQARCIFSLDADFLLHDRDAIRNARTFIAGRRPNGDAPMSRLYVAESTLTITGITADHRLRLQSGRMAALLVALATELSAAGLPLGLPSGVAAPAAPDFDRKWVRAAARDLRESGGRSLVVAGAHLPAAVHAAVAAINGALGAAGKTVTYVDAKETSRSSTADLHQLVGEMQAGAVSTLVILGGNPAYDAPSDLGFRAALDKVANRVRLGLHADETSAACQWHLPEAHYLEAWGDARSVGGPLSVTQPLIEPLFGGRSRIELLWLLATGEEKSGHDLVRETWKATVLSPADFERQWERVLHDGVHPGSELPTTGVRADVKAVAELAASPLAKAAPATNESLEVVFRASDAVHDGRFANVSWLQELPDPVTKLTWDNAAIVSPATASALGLRTNDVARLRVGEKQMNVPVLTLPGHADGSISVALGYGRTAAGRVGNGVGFDAYRLRTTAAPWLASGARLERTGDTHLLVATHDHWSTEGRDLVRESTLEEYRKKEPREGERLPMKSLWPERPYAEPHQWGMSIDLNSCIGCNACVVACQVENNVPVVGKDQVNRGREMHWLRVDRYFSGRAEDPETVVFQPVPCMQCENAPCEQVCPVAATVHDEQGLNVMVYNRCIGTRYCSNNCPYKVRRFNFYNFTKDTPELLKMVQNPDVTVRARGVMEKCSYCVQRITRAKIDARLAGRDVRDGDVQTACQQSCPTRAIEFGDVRDGKSKVSELKGSDRSYVLLAELNTKPRTSYLTRLRNPNPEIAES